jgi:hypothetical protein
LLPYRPDLPKQAGAQDAVVREAAAACHAASTALILEPIIYGEPEPFEELVVGRSTAARTARP